jgi:hypothetical protein
VKVFWPQTCSPRASVTPVETRSCSVTTTGTWGGGQGGEGVEGEQQQTCQHHDDRLENVSLYDSKQG